jgi:hypothetical protein
MTVFVVVKANLLECSVYVVRDASSSATIARRSSIATGCALAKSAASSSFASAVTGYLH